MAFFLQLRLLLWKNFTLKRRKPVTLIFELFIPLALFIILVAIRRTQPAKENAASNFPIWPLPSAGLMAVMQSFCDLSPDADEHGFSTYANSTVHDFLSQLNQVAENHNFFRPGFSLDELNQVPKTYRSLVDDPVMLKAHFENNETEMRFEDLLNNPKIVETFLVKNLSFERALVHEVIHEAVLDRHRIYGTFFSNPNVSKIFDNTEFRNFGGTILPSEIVSALSSEKYEGLFFELLRTRVARTDDKPLQMNPESILTGLKEIIFEENRMNMYFCSQSKSVQLWKCQNETTDCHSQFTKFSKRYCSLKDTEKNSLKKLLIEEVNPSKFITKMNITSSNKAKVDSRLKSFLRDIRVFMNFKRSIRDFRKLADALPQNYCFDNSTRVNDSNNNEDHSDTDDHAINEDKILNGGSGNTTTTPHPFLRIWKSMHKTLCGKELKFKEHLDQPQTLNDLDLSTFQMDKINLLVHVLYNNPKILYVPTGTAADRIIEKANQSFVLFDQVNQYVSKLQSVGEEIKEFLRQNQTRYNLKTLRNMQKDIAESPFGAILLQESIVQEFLSEPDITDENAFVYELDKISLAACSWSRLMEGLRFNIYEGFGTEDDMLKYFKTKAYFDNVTVLAGVVFHMNDDGSLPNHMIYKIRQNASFTRETDRVRSRFWFPGPGAHLDNYYRFGFTWIQDVLERSMIDLYAARDVNEPGTFLQQFPYPCFMQDSFLFMIQHVMPMCLTISWVYSVAMLVQYIVYEKEQRLKEIMKMMGMKNCVHWIAWFLSSLAQMTVTVLMLTFILKYGKVLSYSNPWIIFLTLEIFAISLIMFSFLVSVLYSKAKIAAACAGIMYFMAYVPYLYIAVREEGAQEVVLPWVKAVASLLAPTAFGLGAKYFAFYEEIGVGMQWDNIAKSPAEHDAFHLQAVLTMLVIDIIIYVVLFWYIENVFPGAFGLPRPWYFPIQNSYWFGEGHDVPAIEYVTKQTWWRSSRLSGFQRNPSKFVDGAQYSVGESMEERSDLFEREPENLTLGVSIVDLSKRYKDSSKFALRNLNLNLYEGQITALLGPVGSGKSTTMSLMTGLFPPTSGSASIYGHDIKTGMDEIRNSLGICLQHNTLFDDLTVQEHIWFYSKLKGQNGDEDEIEDLIVQLDLLRKRHQKVDCLSGGMKRKLSVGIAFVGGSRVVFMDEPTAGVDPAARRAIWDLITKYKAGRTILLSTHHMEEADILGDRIAIIENGRLKCCGSPMYLRHHLGEGYHLTVVKKMDKQTMFRTSNCCQLEVTASIRAIAPGTKFVKESQHELHYILSMNDLRAGNYMILFQMLSISKGSLYISSYGVKSTTLEEVFMKAITEKFVESESTPDNDSSDFEIDSSVHHMGTNTLNIPDRPIPDSKIEIQKNLTVPDSGFGESDPNSLSLGDLKGSVEDCKASKVSCSGDVDLLFENSDTFDATTSFIQIPESPSPKVIPLNQPQIEYEKISGNHLIVQQFWAILQKRYLCTKRNIEGLFSQVLLPAFFVSVAMSVALTVPEISDMPELILSPSQFYNLTKPHTNTFVYSNNALDSVNQRQSDDASSEDIVRTFSLPSGIGATCVLYSPFNYSSPWDFKSEGVYLQNSLFDSMCRSVFAHKIPYRSSYEANDIPTTVVSGAPRERLYPICYCAEDKTSFSCPNYGFKDPKSFEVVTGDQIIDISGQNESQYYLYTTDKFRLRRYGGVSVGLTRSTTPTDFGISAPNFFRRIAVEHVGKVWYNNKGYHVLPTYLNVMNNAILRANIPLWKGHPSGFGITVINHPFPNTHNEFKHDEILKGNEVLIAIFIIVAMSFVPASFVLFVVYERYNKSKHLQVISGVHPVVYLTANYLWDICNYMVPAAFIVTILLFFDVPAYTSRSNFPAVVSLFLMYGWCISPVMHLVSYLFKEPSSAYIFLIVINLFVGITCIVTSFLLEVFSSDPFLLKVHMFVKTMFLVFPNYCLGRGLMDMAFNEYLNQFFQKTGQHHKVRSPFEWELIGRSLTAMAATGISFIFITILLELKICRKPRTFEGFLERVGAKDQGDTESENKDETEDKDVTNERHRVLSATAHEDILRVQNLSKVYYTRRLGNLLAVDKLCWGVPAGECFGLLGVNGAGKSSTFQLLTGDSTITAGDAFINGYSVKNDTSLALSNVGYCPQFDALYDELTAREHLDLYAALRGILSRHRPELVEKILRRLDLTQYGDRLCGTYSGGNRRKVSAAIALVGSPSLIFLDEPTSGQDPRSRRFLWDLVLSLVNDGKSIIFTSHTMEECEVLCTRLAIMVNGRFKCLGSIQHLKNKFGNGYSITVRCGKDRGTEKVEKYFKKAFPHAVYKEKHYNTLRYEISSEFVSLEDIFCKMERALSGISIIEDYYVSQNTLDNVFINFAKQQTDNLINESRDSERTTPPEDIDYPEDCLQEVNEKLLPDIVN